MTDDVSTTDVIPDDVDATDATDATDDVSTTDVADATGDDVTTDDVTYADFDLGEGIQLDETALAEASPVFKELGLTKDQAQKLVGIYSKQIQAGAAKQVEDFNNQVSEWRDKSKNDSEFGGDKFEENVKIAQSAVNKFGTPELKQMMDEYGISNHPELVRFMVKVGKLTIEDVPDGKNSVASSKDRVSLLYPNDRNS